MPAYSLKTDPLGFQSVDPMPTAHELQEFYNRQYFQNETGQYRQAYGDEELLYFANYSKVILGVLKQHGAQGSLLDAGCGEGFLMKEGLGAGFDVFGVDYSSHGLESQNPSLSSRFVEGDLLNLSGSMGGMRFGSVVAKNVLEHVIDPRATLRELKGVLQPGGLLSVVVPNDFSNLHHELLRSGALAKPYWFGPPQHLHYFQFESLARLLEDEGFEVLDSLGDYPVDLFLLHPETNYYETGKEFGKTAHEVRYKTVNFLCREGYEPCAEWMRANERLALGRSILMFARLR